MRPFQIITLSVFAVLALLGLLLFATFKGTGTNKSVGNVTVWGTLPASAVNAAIDDLRRNHKEFGTITYVERDPGTFDSDLSEAIASGSGPDLLITTQERLRAEASKLSVIPFSSIPERTYRDTYLPIHELFLTSTGTYGIPLAVDPLVLYYNRATLVSANVALPPSTWEAVVGLAPHLTARTGVGTIQKSAIALGAYDNIPAARAIVSLLLLQSGSHIVETSTAGTRGALTTGVGPDASGVAPAESAMNFYTQFADPAKVVYSWNRSLPDARQTFISGDTAFYIGFASERSLIAASNPHLDFDMAPIPQPQTAASKTDYGIAYAFALPKASGNPTGAFRVASALASKAEAPLLVKPAGMAPAIRSLLTPSSNDAYAPVVYSQALIASGWLSPSPAVTDRIFAAMINSIISGSATVHDALSTADESLTAAL
ncbi:MAG: ABC transporter substrate-binding protein [Bacillota bacterium]